MDNETKEEVRKLLRNYMNAYWLRPETAVWRVADWIGTKYFKFEAPILDFACGDGLNSFIRMGNNLPIEIDDSLSTVDVNPKEFFEDYVDIYNDANNDFEELKEEAKFKIDVGTDWKQGLLDKAKKLKFYDKLILHDGNKPLPFEDESFNTIFSNSVYWMDETDSILKEMYRVLKKGGRVNLILANPNIYKYNLYKIFNNKWSKVLDRGRSLHYKSLLNDSEWEEKFKKTGFKINNKGKHINPNLLYMHEVGLRPISPVLIKMANSLTQDKRNEIKKEWIDYMEYIFMPFFEEEYFTSDHKDVAYYSFELIKE